MASRILHLAVAEEIMKQVSIKDRNRFRLGCILPDAYSTGIPKADSHLKIFVCGNSKKTYDLDRFIALFKSEMYADELYLGYYMHLIQDMVFRELMYDKYKWNPTLPGNIQRLHGDYHLTNSYAIKRYGVTNDVKMICGLKNEKLYSLYPFEAEGFLCDMENDFSDTGEGDIFFFTEAMVDEFVENATDVCMKEIQAFAKGGHYMDAYEHAWLNKPFSLLKTTQNTRDLGGYKTGDGAWIREGVLLRSDVQNCPCDEDFEYLKARGITTVIDMRGQKDVDRKPSGFAGKEGFTYFNFQVNEGSGVPESVEAVPESYMGIAGAQAMPDVFRTIANAPAGVMFNCTAGKDRTGVVAAILLCHAGVDDRDIIENYVLTREYGKERLELVHKNFPELDMNIVTPQEWFMQEFLRRFRERYKDTEGYFRAIGLTDKESRAIWEKMRKN